MDRLEKAIYDDIHAADSLNVLWESKYTIRKNLKDVLSVFVCTKETWVYCKRCKNWGRK